MSRFKYILFALLLTIGLGSGCEQLILDTDTVDSPRENFEYLWQECLEKYSFFEYKDIDWQEVYNRYSPQINENMSQIELFDVLAAMLNELRDGHVNLISPLNVSRFDIDLLGQDNFEFRLIRENYLGDDYYRTGAFTHDFIADDRVAYVRYSSFNNFPSNLDLDFLFLRYENTVGMIIDLRENGGGSLSNALRILNRFAPEKQLIYNSFIKNGPGPDDFAAAQAAYVEPLEDRLTYDKPVIVLVDRGTYSAASFFSLGALALPNMSLMGDVTGGGLGIPNGGQLPNGWTYRFSISQTLTPDGQNYEDGIPPDERINLSLGDRNLGKDSIIERAILRLTR